MAEGDIYRATLESRYTDSGVRVNNVLWFRELADLDSPIPESALGQSLRTAVLPAAGTGPGAILELMGTNYTYDNWRVQRMTPGMPGGAVLTTIERTGMSSRTKVPSVCAVDCKLQSVYNHRRGRGRLYLAGLAALTATDGVPVLSGSARWASNTVSSILAWLDALFNAFSSTNPDNEGFEWGVWSKTVAGPHAPYDDVAFSRMADFSVDPIIRCQRRREEGVGY